MQAVPGPSKLAQFEIVRRLGAGGMAEVFLAKKPGAEGTYKLLVLKRILSQPGQQQASRRMRTMFVEEAQLATRLNHPNVVQVFDFFDGGDEGQLLSMEYVEGPDLGMLVSSAKAKSTRIPPWIGAWVISEAAKGLHYAHEKKDDAGAPLEIVHRDVSPQNILLSYEGSVKIADFGIATAKLFTDEAGVIKGKFGYMSPEQARGEKVDRRSDVYALGVIMWEILTGRPLHGGLGGEALLDIVRSGFVEPPSTYARDVPPELEQIVMKALEARRDDRYATARELGNAIARALMAKQELVDATALEGVIAQLVVRAASTVDVAPPPREEEDDDKREARAPLTRDKPEGSPDTGPQPSELDSEAMGPRRPVGPAREVRHVAVVTLHLHGISRLKEQDPTLATRTLDRLRTMLGDIAYKRNVRVWIWSNDEEAQAVAGLTANPTRAAADAAWLALDTHEAIAGLNEDLPLPIGASIGVVRGIAAGVRDTHGNLIRFKLDNPAPYLAEALGKATPLYRTWVAGGVYRIVRREFRWGDAPALALPNPNKLPDVPQQMRIYALERSLSREERLAASASGGSDLVGRDAEKADLQAAYHKAVSAAGGGGQVVHRAVTGELGIGKTALVSAFIGELPPNARLVRAECSPVRMEVPLTVIGDLVRDTIGVTGDEPFEEVADLIARAGGGAAHGDATTPIVARLAELATNRTFGDGDEDAQFRRRNIVAGLRNLFGAIALSQPLVVVIESLQWADKQSIEVLGELMRQPDPLPTLFVLVARPDDRLAVLLEGVVRIELAGLTADEQVRLVEARVGARDGVRQVLGDLMPRVGGNPFFLLEMVDALLERGALELREVPGDDGETRPVLAYAKTAGRESVQLPSTLEQLLSDRLRELPTEEHIVVDWLAIAGGPLAVTDLEKLAPKIHEDAVVRLCARGLCDRKIDQVDFRHPLTRDVAYASMAAEDRIQMHRALGEHLKTTSLARGLSAAIVARHLARGEEGEQASDLYAEAGHAARAGNQTQLAIRYLKRATMHLSPNDERQLSLQAELETLYRMLGRRRERIRHLEALRRSARRIGTPRATCIALLRTARFYYDEGRLSSGLPTAKLAAEIAHGASMTQLEVEAEALVSEFLRELGDVQGALAACDRALATCNPALNPNLPPRTSRGRAPLARRSSSSRRSRARSDGSAHPSDRGIPQGGRTATRSAREELARVRAVRARSIRGCDRARCRIDPNRFVDRRTFSNRQHAHEHRARVREGRGPAARDGVFAARARDARALRRPRQPRRHAHRERGDGDGSRRNRRGRSVSARRSGARRGDGQRVRRDSPRRHPRGVRARESRRIVRDQLRARSAARGRRSNARLFHFYGMAVEAAARVDAGEMHAGTLLATTALGAVETIQGCEYGLEIRVLCADALKRAGSPQAPLAHQRAVDHAHALMNGIRDARLRRMFVKRPIVASLFDTTPAPAILDGEHR